MPLDRTEKMTLEKEKLILGDGEDERTLWVDPDTEEEEKREKRAHKYQERAEIRERSGEK